EFQDELKLWDTALNDGLEDAPWYEEERLTCMLLHPDAESIIHECLSEMRIESDVRLGRTSNRKLLVLWSSPAIPDLESAIAHRLRSDQLPFANIELVPLLSWRTSAAK